MNGLWNLIPILAIPCGIALSVALIYWMIRELSRLEEYFFNAGWDAATEFWRSRPADHSPESTAYTEEEQP